MDRVRNISNMSSAQRVQASLLENFRFVEHAMLHGKCSAYAMEVSVRTRGCTPFMSIGLTPEPPPPPCQARREEPCGWTCIVVM